MSSKKKKVSKNPGRGQSRGKNQTGRVLPDSKVSGGLYIVVFAAIAVLVLAAGIWGGMQHGSDPDDGSSGRLKILDLSGDDSGGSDYSGWASEPMKLADGNNPIIEKDVTCYGVLNGHVIDPEGNTFSSIFPEEDWLYNYDYDNNSSDVVVFNEMYPYLELSLHPQGKSNLSNVTFEDLENNGFVGYQVSCEAGLDCPEMSWAGLTFGASLDDIRAVYGEPDSSIEADMFTTVLYRLGDWVLKMFVYNDGIDGTPGLYSVSLTAVTG